jgi:hypothetical protein
MFPFMYINAGIRSKIAFFDAGSPYFLKNFAAAACAGANVSLMERNRTRFYYAGLIFGTRIPVAHGEMEFIYQPTFFKNTTESEAGDVAGIILHERGVDNAIGLIYWPFQTRLLQFNMGMTTRMPFKRDLHTFLGKGTVTSHFSPFIFQGTVVLNIY